MVSSAVYRYFPSRDELLTALIIDAYDAVGEAAEVADASAVAGGRVGLRQRWVIVCQAIRRWALEDPHQYALVYGSPVPGYQAPVDTIGPAARVTRVLAGIVAEGSMEGRLHSANDPPVPSALAADATRAADAVMPGVSADVVLRALTAWTQLFGALSLELFGHLHGVIENYDGFFERAVTSMAEYVGLPDEAKLPD
jgi:AcrR family transcriptional regulator